MTAVIVHYFCNQLCQHSKTQGTLDGYSEDNRSLSFNRVMSVASDHKNISPSYEVDRVQAVT